MAYRLPEYLAGKVEMSPSGGVGQYDMSQMYYQQREQNAALAKLGNMIEDATRKVEKQESDNIVNKEQNAMMDHFQKWYEDSANQQGMNKVTSFETAAKSHMENLRKQYEARPDLVARMENSWQNHYWSFTNTLRHEYRKEVVSSARAIVDDGNTKFLDSIFSLKDNPDEVYRRLDERIGAIAGLVETGALKADDAVALQNGLRNKTDISRASMALETNVRGALAALQDPKQFTFLDGKQRSTLINQAQAQIRQEEAQARMEARLARAERAADFQMNVAPGAATAIDGYMKTGQKSADFESYKAAILANKDLPAAKMLWKHLNQAEQDMPHIIEARSMSLGELGKTIADLRTQNQSGALSGEGQRQLQAREKVLGDMMQARGSGDLLGYYTKIGMPVVPLSPENLTAQTIENRKKWIGIAKDQFGAEPDALQANEAKAFHDLFKNGDQGDKQKVATAVAALSTTVDGEGKINLDTARLQKTLKAVGSENPAIMDEMWFRIQGNQKLADEMMQGRALYHNNNDKFPSREKLNKSVYDMLNNLGFKTIDPYGTEAKRFVAGISELYIGRYGKKGVIDSIDDTDLKAVATDYFNVKDFVTMNGQKTLPVTPSQTQYEFNVMWNNVEEADLKKASGGAEFYTRNGTTFSPLSIDQIKKKGVLRPVGEGEYVIEMPRASGFFGRDSYETDVIVKDKYGQPITFNMRSVVQDVDTRLKSRIAQGVTE